MGSSRKHKEKEKEKGRRSRSRSKSREREKGHRRHKERKRGHRREEGDDQEDRDSPPPVPSKQAKRSDEKEREREGREGREGRVKQEPRSPGSEARSQAPEDHQEQEEKDDKDKDQKEGEKLTLSVDDTNKLRAKLGLKPLDTEPKEDDGEKAKEVFVKTENISHKQEAEKIKQRLQVQKEKRKIADKLKRVKGLAEEEEEDDLSSWIERSREIEKKRANAKALMFEERDREMQEKEDAPAPRPRAEYKGRDLRGLTVGHSRDTFKEGHQIILTLKDKGVLEEVDDVLENVNLIDDEKSAKNVKVKAKGKVDYIPYAEKGEDEEKNLLTKYDEEIDGEKKESFKLGLESVLDNLRKQQEEEATSRGISLDMMGKIASEYYTEEEMMKFKKPKRKMKKTLRKRRVEEELQPLLTVVPPVVEARSRDSSEQDLSEHVDGKQEHKKIKMPLNIDLESEVMEDDDYDLSKIPLEEDEAEQELQAALEKARKQRRQANPAGSSIERVAKFTTANREADEDDDAANNFITLNSTAEFCRNLGDIPTYGLAGNREGDVDQEVEEMMDSEHKEEDDEEEPAAPVEDERVGPSKGQWNEVDLEAEEKDDSLPAFGVSEGQPILEEEPDVTVGLAGALQLALKKGYLDKDTKKLASVSRQSMLEAQNYQIEEKFYDDDKHGGGRRERYSGPVSEFRDKDGYRPDVKLDYVDDNGRILNQKEAFRVLSHKFHGKGPGKNKVDKRMKKINQDSKLRQMSSTDTPLGTVKLLQEKQKELQSPYVLLSGPPTSLSKKK